MPLDTVSAIVLLVIVSLTAYSISTDMQSNYVGCYLYFVDRVENVGVRVTP